MVLSSGKDLVGVIFFGTTKKDEDAFKYITVFQDLKVPSAEFVIDLGKELGPCIPFLSFCPFLSVLNFSCFITILVSLEFVSFCFFFPFSFMISNSTGSNLKNILFSTCRLRFRRSQAEGRLGLCEERQAERSFVDLWRPVQELVSSTHHRFHKKNLRIMGSKT
jgi:hypothetical protein